MTRKGFTLIELLVVVLIIGILAAIALPRYQIAVNKSKTAEAMIALMAITTAQESYFLTHGEYTSDLNQLEITVPVPAKYYNYSCSRTCYARPKYSNLPVLEFHMQRSTMDAQSNYLGKHWCQTSDISNPKEIATAICQSLGKADTSMNTGYYIIY